VPDDDQNVARVHACVRNQVVLRLKALHAQADPEDQHTVVPSSIDSETGDCCMIVSHNSRAVVAHAQATYVGSS
jgi:hypothetical protein